MYNYFVLSVNGINKNNYNNIDSIEIYFNIQYIGAAKVSGVISGYIWLYNKM